MTTNMTDSLKKRFLSTAGFFPAVAMLIMGLLAQPASAQKKLKIFAFYPDWNKLTGVTNEQLDRLTHVIYFSIPPPKDGNVTDVYVASKLDGQSLIEVVDRGGPRGVKVLLGVGGAAMGGVNPSLFFPDLAKDATARTKFATTIAKFCRDNGLGGIDIDWEFPSSSGADLTNLGLLLDEVRKAFSTDLIVTLSINPEITYGKAALDKANDVLVMSYDNSPPTTIQAEKDMTKVAGIVTDKVKLSLGVPFYGRIGWPGGAPLEYRNIVKANPTLSPTADQVGNYTFNGTTTLAAKTDIVINNGYGGLMIWEITSDHKDTPAGRLLSAMYNEILAKGAVLDKRPTTFVRRRPATLMPLLQVEGNLLKLSAVSGGKHRLTLHSPSGRVMRMADAEALPGGSLTWSVPDLVGGAYFYEIQGGTAVFKGSLRIGQ